MRGKEQIGKISESQPLDNRPVLVARGSCGCRSDSSQARRDGKIRESYPTRPVRVVVGFAAGTADIGAPCAIYAAHSAASRASIAGSGTRPVPETATGITTTGQGRRAGITRAWLAGRPSAQAARVVPALFSAAPSASAAVCA
jgi:hypothetical protein